MCLGVIIALLIIIVGLVVLALPDTMEGKVMVRWSAYHSLRVADIIGGVLVASGAALTWATALAWQRTRIG
jgi:uncharacterized membrane protein